MSRPDVRYQRTAYLARERGGDSVVRLALKRGVTPNAIYAAAYRYADRLDEMARRGIPVEPQRRRR